MGPDSMERKLGYFLENANVFNTLETQKHLNEIYTKKIGIPPNIYLFKVNNKNTRKSCEICSKFTLKTPEI